MMTRRTFEALADALHELREEDGTDPAAWSRTVRAVGDVCAASNPRFDRGRFERWAREGRRRSS